MNDIMFDKESAELKNTDFLEEAAEKKKLFNYDSKTVIEVCGGRKSAKHLMAHIRLTFQKPDETEIHEISGEDGDSQSFNLQPENSFLLKTVANESSELLSPSFLSSRRGSGLSVPSHSNASVVQPRKFSFPAALPSGLLGIESTGMGLLTRRRFSNVSDAVTRKLSHTIGWRSGHVQAREIVAVGKSLCSQYIRSRLKRSGYLNRKCGLQRLRSAVSLPSGVVFREVYPELLALGVELERLHPKVYVNVTRQASSVPGGRLTSEKQAGAVLTAVSRELLKNELTWGKIVSLYAVAGGLAVDCARQGHYEYLSSIVEAMEEVLEEDLAHWIQYRGGWCALSALVRPPTSKWPSAKILTLVFSFIIVAFLIVFTLGLFGISTFL